jgi:hypothetical protein
MDSLMLSYPDSVYSLAAARDFYGLEESGAKDFSVLKQKYQTDSMFYQTEDLQRTAGFMIKECNLRMKNYDEAIDWLNNEVENPYNYADSICALIDLGFVNTLMNANGLKNVQEFTPNGMKLPKTKAQQQKWYTDHLLKLFFETTSSNGIIPKEKDELSNISLTFFGPNPCRETATVRSICGILSASVVNIFGQVIRDVVFYNDGKEVRIDFSQLRPGLYNIILQTNNGIVVHKVVHL